MIPTVKLFPLQFSVYQIHRGCCKGQLSTGKLPRWNARADDSFDFLRIAQRAAEGRELGACAVSTCRLVSFVEGRAGSSLSSKKMSAGALPLLCMVLVSFLAGSSVEANCSKGDKMAQTDCINSKQAELVDFVLFASSMPCDELLTTQRCSVLSEVVTCLNGKAFTNDSCRVNFDFTEVNTLYKLPCTLGEIYQACPDLPQLKGVNHTSSTSDANANNNNNNNNDNDDSSGGSDKMAKTNTKNNNENNDISGSRRQDVTYFLLMTSLMTTFFFGVHC